MSRTTRNVPGGATGYTERFKARLARGLVPWPIRALDGPGEVWTPHMKRFVKRTRNRVERRTYRISED